MNDIELLSNHLSDRFPDASLKIDPAETASGSWWLDMELKDHAVVVEWKPGTGFGVSTPSVDDFGAGADELYLDEHSAFERVKELLLGRLKTVRPQEVSLSRLRELRHLSQVELATRLHVSQGALSRMERRTDMLLGSLRNTIAAMGGELELRASFPDGAVVRISFDEVYGDADQEPKLANDNYALGA